MKAEDVIKFSYEATYAHIENENNDTVFITLAMYIVIDAGNAKGTAAALYA